MTQKLRFSDIFEDKKSHKTILKFGIVLLLSIEMIIYLVANSHSGSEPWVNIYDSKGQRIYETEGNVLTPYEKLVFQETYGPLNNYQVRIETRSTPFPFRAWLAVAVGAPIGFMLLLTYLVRAYLSFVEGEQEEDTNNFGFLKDNSGKFRPWSNWQRLSLFHFGFLILVGVLSFWLVPDFVADITSRAISLIAKYKWFFLGVFVFSASLLIWVIYLKYKIAERMMDRQMDLEKFRVEKQLLLEQNSRLALPVPDAPSPLKTGQVNGGNVEQ